MEKKKKTKGSNCPHVGVVGDNTWEDVQKHKQGQRRCEQCGKEGNNLWLCLHHRCLFVGCGEAGKDCSTQHGQENGHSLTLNMTSMRIWCYSCESEVFRDRNNPPFIMRQRRISLSQQRAIHDQIAEHENRCPNQSRSDSSQRTRRYSQNGNESSSEDDDEDNDRPRGLTGLQNLGNTCYMNAALQALSNCPPLTQFFLDCPGFLQLVRLNNRKLIMSHSFYKLLSDIWHKKRPSYAVPSSLAGGIKIIHPMFRGYTQQDTQEFLRCFMDQLHEELKQPITGDKTDDDDEEEEQSEVKANENTCNIEIERLTTKVSNTKMKDSDHEYETCDSCISSTRSSIENSTGTCSEENASKPGSCDSEEIKSGSSSEICSTVSGTLVESRNVENQPPESNVNMNEANATHNEAVLSDRENMSDSGVSSHEGSNKNESEESGVYVPPTTRSSIKKQSDIAKTTSRDSGLSSSCSDCSIQNQTTQKEVKENTNLAKKQASTGVETLPPEEVARSERLERITQHLAPDGASSQDKSSPRSTSPSSKQGGRSRQASETDRSFMKTTSLSQLPSVKSSHTNSTKKKKPVEYQSVISDVFDGKILSSVQCLKCDRISTTKETFQDLSLPIPSKDHLHVIHHKGQPPSQVMHKGACGEVNHQGWFSWMFTWMRSWFWGPTVKLQDCLAAFFSADELKGDNMYSCEKCKKLRNGIKYSRVLQLPEVLSIHLKRFRHEFMFSTKISTHVTFPLDGLDMKPYLDKDCKDEVTQYDLVAVICHHGTAGGGHYTSYALNYINETWYEYDDQYVTPVDMQTVENCEAYVLFYRKKNDDMLVKRKRASDIADSHENSFMKFFISKQWINKFNTFAEPGPISNHDFLCRHGGVHPYKYEFVESLTIEVSQTMWEYLHKMYGGGPSVTHLYSCTLCKEEIDKLKSRQKYERETFIKMNDEFSKEETTSAIYAISMAWFKDWENFVRDKTQEPPGPIDNSRISFSRGGVHMLRHNSDYGQVSEEMWYFLYEIYGGGPELISRAALKPDTRDMRDNDEVEDSD